MTQSLRVVIADRAEEVWLAVQRAAVIARDQHGLQAGLGARSERVQEVRSELVDRLSEERRSHRRSAVQDEFETAVLIGGGGQGEHR